MNPRKMSVISSLQLRFEPDPFWMRVIYIIAMSTHWVNFLLSLKLN